MAKDGVICKWQNPDKLGHHKDKKRPEIGFQHPSRAIICGRQNCGKGVCAMNIIAKAEPRGALAAANSYTNSY